jgi:flavin-dependent dehydrogenase
MRGANVLVADALMPPINKACGEGLMPDAHRDLAALGVICEPSQGPTFQGIRFANWTQGEQISVAAEFSSGTGIGMSRPALHSRIVERAQTLGVRFRWGTHVGFGSGVTLNQETCSYRYLIGADGQSSRVRRWAGLEKGKIISHRFGFRRHYCVAPWSRYVEVHWTALGQVYVTPIAENEICVAVVTRDRNARVRDVVDTISFLRDRLPREQERDAERGALTTTRKLNRVVSGNVALVGDASGSVDAVTGEGMALSFRQATLLSESLEKNALERYAVGHRKILAQSQLMARLLLLMDAYPVICKHAMRSMADSPGLFRGLLDVHIGELTMSSFLIRNCIKIAASCLIAPYRHTEISDGGAGSNSPFRTIHT